MNIELFLLGGAYETQAIDGFACLWDCETFPEFKEMCGDLLLVYTWSEEESKAVYGDSKDATRFPMPPEGHLLSMFERVVSYRSED